MLEWTEVTFIDGLKLRLVASDLGVRSIEFNPGPALSGEQNNDNALLREVATQLQEYFAGKRREFRLVLDMQGTEFQKRVWRQLETIPYGETRSYAQIAGAIGRPKAVRAVGAANGANPIPIVVPCHRVIGSSGKLTGYGGGLPLKKKLLELEGARALALGL
ncbi:MAG TPA: methylated-DNA--[protein]-cysteine S-methyltransferase [Bryobacteraceae bacterium]|nr:methylated-DNA--[protein]-cysteine S-methyltransferase [Bryobacteraceae bacterium]